MIRFAENLNKMIAAGLGGAMEAPSTEVAVGHRVRYMEASGAVAGFETNIAAPIRSLRVDMQPIQAGSGDPSPDNVRPITGRESVTVWREASYNPSADPALTIALGQTVYGGTLDVVSGVLTVDRAMVDLGTLLFNKDKAGYFQTVSKETSLNDAKHYYSYQTANIMCSQYKPYAVGPLPNLNNVIGMYWYDSENRNILRIKDTKFDESTAGEFKAAMNGVQFVYELATPITIDLTPAQLSTLKGQNNVWSNSGDVTLDYPYYEETEGY